ncbi:hypothetical protein AN161_26805, partial [Lysinibacillus sp. FJAT-14222]
YTFYKPAKVADKAKDGAKIIESQAERIKKNVDESARARDSSKFDDYAKKEKEILEKQRTKNIAQNGKNVLNNYDISKAYVKPKHLATSGGKARKFVGDTKAEAEAILRDAMKKR